MATEDKNLNAEKEIKRNRRTQDDLLNILLQGVDEEIKEKGFNKATVVGIIQRANVQASVFYNRFNDLDDLFNKMVMEYDYWLNDSAKLNPVKLTPIENIENVLVNLVDALNGNEIMQELLIWELSDKNDITRRTANNRERNTKEMLDYFSSGLKSSVINFDIFAAIIVSGIYYLVLHKKISPFCGIDFSKKEGIDYLKKSLIKLIKLIYNNPASVADSLTRSNNEKILNIAKTLINKGVDIAIIKEATQLSDGELLLLSSGNKKRGRPKKNS